MNTLIVAGLMAFGLLAIVTAVLLAMGENKTPSSITSSSTPEIPTAAPLPTGTNPVPALVATQQLPAIRKESQVTVISAQFSELTAQLHALQEQAREIEQRLNILSDITIKIERNQSFVSIEETKDYRLLKPVNSGHA